MSLLVTGSVGIDTVSTPHGRAENVLGGSAVYFAFSAMHYVPVRLVGAVGGDFPEEFRRLLEGRSIDLAGLEVRQASRTFRWTGRFEGDMKAAETVSVDLNVLAEHAPKVPGEFADSKVVFLANTHPTLQRELCKQVRAPRLVVCDTMNLWIENERASLLETFSMVHGVIINDAEARQLTGRVNLVDAAAAMLEHGPSFVVVKKGEHGALLMTGEGPSPIPAYPTREVRDPTGAGDSFAGGFMGFLAGQADHTTPTLRRAMIRGTVAASFAIEGFSLDGVASRSRTEIDDRVNRFREMLAVD